LRSPSVAGLPCGALAFSSSLLFCTLPNVCHFTA
jgi:hypothetical protein